MTTYVYSLFDSKNPEIYRYIGISVNPETRLLEHLADADKKNTLKSNWIKKLISEGSTLNYKVLFEFESRIQAGLKEIELIKKYRSENPKNKKLTNMTIGGEGTALFKERLVFSKKKTKKLKRKRINLVLQNKNLITKLQKKELRKKIFQDERNQKFEKMKAIDASVTLQAEKALQIKPKKILISAPKNRWEWNEDEF